MAVNRSGVAFQPGPRFGEVRELAGLTQADLGVRTGMGQSGVSRFERGHRAVRGKLAHAIARALKLTLDDAISQDVLTLVRITQEESDGSEPARSG